MSSSHCVVKCRHLIVSLYIVILCVSGEAQTPQYDHEYQPPFHHKEYTTVNNTPYGESRVSVSSLVIHIELSGDIGNDHWSPFFTMPSPWFSLVFFYSQMTQHTTQKMVPMAANWKTMHQVRNKGGRCVFHLSQNYTRQVAVNHLVSVKWGASWPRRASVLMHN